jgi:hypothetical protein
MKIKHFYLGLSDDDYLIPNPPESKFPFRTSKMVSEFNFQSDFITHYIENHLKKMKYESNDFDMIMIRGKKQPKENFFIEKHHKCLTIEVFFDDKKYKELYSLENKYPLDNLLKPIVKEDEFNEFVFKMIMEGLEKLRKQKALIPFDFLIDTTLDFKTNNYKNEWIHKRKVIKEYGIKPYLTCKLTCNYFSLNLIIEEGKQEIYRQEVLRTLPSAIFYKDEFKDLKIDKKNLVITKKSNEKPYLFSLKLSKVS